jgi:hypothetical protein
MKGNQMQQPKQIRYLTTPTIQLLLSLILQRKTELVLAEDNPSIIALFDNALEEIRG